MKALGIFNDEGMLDGPFYTKESADAALAKMIKGGEDPKDLDIDEVCPVHDDQRYHSCDACLDDEQAEMDAENEDP